MDIRQCVGQNLRNLREANGLSQEALAFKCGLDRSYISGIERGLRNPTVVVLDELAKILQTPVVAFFADYVPRKRG